jgi:hypothetical protein
MQEDSFVVEFLRSYKNVGESLLPQIYARQKIINYASGKKRGRLQRSNEKVRYEEFSTQCTVSKVRPAESRSAGKRAGRDYYFSNSEEGQHLMASVETVTSAKAINKS